MDHLTKDEANDLLRALLVNLRNALATFGPDHPQTDSVKETVRAFLLSMRRYGIETDLSRTSLPSTEPGRRTLSQELPVDARQKHTESTTADCSEDSMALDPPQSGVDELIGQLMASMKLV